MASEPKTGNVLGYDPSCLLCNLRSDPYCLKCVKSRERKTGNACAGHRTPCGVVKHPDIRTEREDVNPPAPSESVKQEPAPLPQDQDYPEPGSFEDEPRVAEPVLQETTLQLGTTQIGDGGSKAGQTEAQERLRQEFLPSTGNGVAPEPPATVPRTAEPEPQVLNDSQLDNALRALRLGFKVFPCHPRSKKPAGEAAPNGVKDATADEAQIRRWWAQNPDYNPGVTGGTIVDCDKGLTSLETARNFAALNGLPPTLAVRTGRRDAYGVQFHFTGQVSRSGPYEANGVTGEVRAGNLYGMAPGAIHPDTGETYEIIVDLPLAPCPPDLLAKSIEGLRRRNVSKVAHGEKITHPGRHDWLVSQAGRLFNAGVHGEALLAALRQLNKEHCEPPKDDDHLRGIVSDAEKGWERPPVFDPQKEHNDALARIDALLMGSEPVGMEDGMRATRDLKLLTLLAEREHRRKRLAQRLGWRVSVLDQEIEKQQSPPGSDFDAATAPLDAVRLRLESLLDGESSEAARKLAETTIWNYIRAHAQVFCCGNVGYLLLRDGDGVPIGVTRDGQDFNQLLIRFGVHPGSPTRDRIGKFVGTKCYHEGIKAETQLSFSFEPRTFTAYVARDRGRLIRVTRRGFEDVPNGTDGQLFIFPPNWQPLLSNPMSVPEPVRMVNGKSNPIFKRALFPDGNLARHFFGGTTFEIRSMSEQQVRILILAYVFFLIMPGVVSERAMLQALGPSGSGKTLLLEYFGRLLLGDKFKAQPLPEDLREFENQIINRYFIVYDNVSRVPASIKDRFCQAVTGVDVVRRELFTTAQEARYPSKATLALSAIDPPLQELEHQNRTISINFQERAEGSFIAKEELFKVLNHCRGDIILNLLWRMRLVLEALEAQRNYVPRTSVRLASIATFILRIARHEGWEEEANQLLAAWAGEQTDYSMTEDDVSIALTRWIGGADWKPDVELTSSMLNAHLCQAMGVTERGKDKLNWRGNHLVLSKMLVRNGKVYAERFGMERQKSTLRTSRGTNTYRFDPTPERLADLQAAARYERENVPREPDMEPDSRF